MAGTLTKALKKHAFLSVLSVMLVGLASAAVYAQCISPAGTAGEIEFLSGDSDGNWSLVGSALSISSAATPAMTALDSTTVAFIDDSNDDLRTYSWNGSIWSQTGSDLGIVNSDDPALTALDSTTVAYIDDTNDDLTTYSWNGSIWSQTGSDLNISGTNNPSLATLSATTIAFIDDNNDDLRTYSWNGSIWSQVGSDLNISGASNAQITALDSSTIAYIDDSDDDLRTYSWNGSIWSQTGSDLNISGASNAQITALNTTTIAYIDEGNDELRTYSWNGSIWSQTGSDLNIPSAYQPAVAALGNATVALFDSDSNDLATHESGTISDTALQYCDGTDWVTMCPPAPACDTTPIVYSTPGQFTFDAATDAPGCDSITIEAYGAGGGYDVGGGGGGSVVLDTGTPLAVGGGGGGGGNNDGGGGGGFGEATVSISSSDNFDVYVGGGGECVDGAGGEDAGGAYDSCFGGACVADGGDSTHGGGGGATATSSSTIANGGDSTYGGGGGTYIPFAASTTSNGGASNYGGGGGATIGGGGASVANPGSSTNGNAGTTSGGGGGGGLGDSTSTGTNGSNGSGGTAANSGPGNGAGSGCTTKAADGQVVITPSGGGGDVEPLSTDGDLAGYWKLDENTGTTTADSSGNGNNGTFYPSYEPSWTSDGYFNSALTFDGSGELSEVPHSASLDITGNLSIAFWFMNYDTAAAGWDVVAKTDGGLINDRWQYSVQTYGDEIGLFFCAGPNSACETTGPYTPYYNFIHTSSANFVDDQWYHVVLTYDDAGNDIQIYVNGVAQALTINLGQPGGNPENNSIQSNTHPLRIGWSGYASSETDGRIDELRIYDITLTPTEVTEIYEAVVAEYNSSLINHWTLDDTDTTAVDSEGGLDGSMVNGLDGASDSTTGQIDEALTFTGGANERIQVTHNASLNLTEGTWSLWYKSDGSWGTGGSDPTNAAVLMSKVDSNINGGMIMAKGTNQWIGVQAKDSGGTVRCQTNGSVSPANGLDDTWHHIAATFSTASGENMHIYVDGVLSASCTNSGAWAFGTDNLIIGDSNGAWSEEFAGELDDVRIYDTILSAGQIADLYNCAGGAEICGNISGGAPLCISAASCSTPGQYFYDSGSGTMRWCDGADLYEMGGDSGGGGGTCSTPTASAGALNYDSSTNTFRFCDGIDWVDIGK